jgi:hypothetical protein
VYSKARRVAASRARAAAIARVREHNLRWVVESFQMLQERWGRLTLAEIRRVSGLLADHADAIYRLADRVERGAAALRLPKKHGLRPLATRVARAGREDDPVTRAVLARLAELAEASEQPRTTPGRLRELAMDLLDLAEDVETTRVLPRRQPPPLSRGRHRNGPLAWLLDRAAKYGFADVELARALEQRASSRSALAPTRPTSPSAGPRSSSRRGQRSAPMATSTPLTKPD